MHHQERIFLPHQPGATLNIEGRTCHLAVLSGSQRTRIINAHLLFRGCPVSTIEYREGAARASDLPRAFLAIVSFEHSAGRWSASPYVQAEQLLDLDLVASSLSPKSELIRFDHFVEHWSLQTHFEGRATRFLIWDKALARDLFAEVLAAGGSVLASGMLNGMRDTAAAHHRQTRLR